VSASDLLARSDALLVDLDGTLVDSSDPVARVWHAFADRHGLDADEVEHYAHGRPAHETIRVLAPNGDHAAETQAIRRAEIEDTAGVRALPGAAELLGAPPKPLAIVTSCSTAVAHARLRAAGLPIPAVLVSSDGLKRGKPDPACFVIAARRLHVEPSACTVLEDAPAGIQAAKAAGAHVIALRTTHPDEELDGADVVVDDLAALL
jgi:mannitol-1-/sugar-/sorbitol-6-phosphatase